MTLLIDQFKYMRVYNILFLIIAQILSVSSFFVLNQYFCSFVEDSFFELEVSMINQNLTAYEVVLEFNESLKFKSVLSHDVFLQVSDNLCTNAYISYSYCGYNKNMKQFNAIMTTLTLYEMEFYIDDEDDTQMKKVYNDVIKIYDDIIEQYTANENHEECNVINDVEIIEL